MRVQDGGHVAASLFNFFVHLSKICSREILWIKAEVFIAVGLAVIVGPLNVHYEDIDGELVVSEVLVSLHDNLSRCNIILREVEAECVKRR